MVTASVVVLLSGSTVFSKVFATSAIRGIRFLQVNKFRRLRNTAKGIEKNSSAWGNRNKVELGFLAKYLLTDQRILRN